MRRALGSTMLGLAGLAGILALVTFQTRSRPPAAFAVPAAASRPTAVAPGPVSDPSAKPSSAATHRPIADHRPARHRPAGFQPTGIAVASLGLSASVEPILSVGGQLQPPDDPSRVGWWQGSALGAAAAGSTVLVGHVDSAHSGLGAFYRLDQVRAGSVVDLSGAGRSTSYRVSSLQYVHKSDGLPATLFRVGGPPRLILITCGGSFDQQQQSYRDNVVVIAEPVSG